MAKKIAVVRIVFFWIAAMMLTAAYAAGQDQNAKQPASAAPAATQQDVKDSERQINENIRKADQKAAQRAAEAQEDARRSALKQGNGITTAITEIDKSRKKADEQSAAQIAAINAQAVQAEKTKNFLVLGAFTVFLLLGGLGWWLHNALAKSAANAQRVEEWRRQEEARLAELAAAPQPVQPAAPTPIVRLRIDPTSEEIRQYGDESGLERFPVMVRLRDHGNDIVRGQVFKDSHGVWVIQFPNVLPRSLDKRGKAALESSFITSAKEPRTEEDGLTQ